MAKFTPVDYQKAKLEKLMKNIDKPIEIPERRKGAKFAEPPEFVRNIMGSSAGAGSGEFHVYRHLRRKEYARQRFIEEQAKREDLDRQFKEKLEANKQLAEEKTAKKRKKRLKKKSKLKANKKGKKINSQSDDRSKESSDEGDSTCDEESTTIEELQPKNSDPIKNKGDNSNDDEEIGPKVEDFLKCGSSTA